MNTHSWSLTESPDVFMCGADGVQACIEQALTQAGNDGNPPPTVVYVGVNREPVVMAEGLAEYVDDEIRAQLEGEVGEVAANYDGLPEGERDALEKYLSDMIGRLNFHCYTVEHVKPYGPDSPEYRAATASVGTLAD